VLEKIRGQNYACNTWRIMDIGTYTLGQDLTGSCTKKSFPSVSTGFSPDLAHVFYACTC
jgi:hypothetical protein